MENGGFQEEVEPFEDIRIAAPREVSEEIGLEVVLENIIAMQYHRSEREHPILNTTYSSKIIEGTKAGLNKILLVDYGWGYDLKLIPEYKSKYSVKKPKDLIEAIKKY